MYNNTSKILRVETGIILPYSEKVLTTSALDEKIAKMKKHINTLSSPTSAARGQLTLLEQAKEVAKEPVPVLTENYEPKSKHRCSKVTKQTKQFILYAFQNVYRAYRNYPSDSWQFQQALGDVHKAAMKAGVKNSDELQKQAETSNKSY